MYIPTALRFFFVTALAILLSSSIAAASDSGANISLSKYDTQMFIEYNKVLVESSILFTEKEKVNFSIELPFDARAVTSKIETLKNPATLDENNLLFVLKNNKEANYSYITNDFLDQDSFIFSTIVPFDTENFILRVSLPEKSTLDRPLRQGASTGSAVYPKPKALETDGRVITVVWEFTDVEQGEELAFYVKYKRPFRYMIPIILVVCGIVIVLAGLAYLVYFRNKRERQKPVMESKDAAHHSSIMEGHLKEDEQQVVNILKLKEGSCEQGTLRVATGFSKAKLSGLLKEMEERKIILKEKRGKKNLVFLK